ncbi:MAG: 23S rRNA (uracil(1939)-C(5))-methyltransferase RlmD, partial [Endomicrobia bacterium]|nr:23S rRNA (uracil(1939)-C(5))-methyltransferase RlmD [Endomicrobiia bacterium]
KENIRIAEKNAQLNSCNEKVEFVCDQVEVFILKLWKSKFITNLSTLVIDPPRPGLSKRVKNALINITANRIIYISCNPHSLYEDLKSFLKFYKIKKIIPIDMFPHTPHIEIVCVLEHK